MKMLTFKNACDGAYSSIDVRFLKACDNACNFCIENDGLDFLGKAPAMSLAQRLLSTGIKDTLILGGEPFLDPDKLLEFVSIIRPHMNTIYITTSLPKTFLTKQDTIEKILYLINGLNVSIQDIDPDKNNDILKASSRHNRLEILHTLNSNLTFAKKIRVNLNLTKGGLDTYDKVQEALIFLRSIGCREVKLNELQDSEDYVSYEDISSIKMESPYAHGCQTIIQNDRDFKVLLKRSCFITEESRLVSFMDIVKLCINYFRKPKNKFRVMYENGLIKNNWLKKDEEKK